jgi:hypothetical protein
MFLFWFRLLMPGKCQRELDPGPCKTFLGKAPPTWSTGPCVAPTLGLEPRLAASANFLQSGLKSWDGPSPSLNHRSQSHALKQAETSSTSVFENIDFNVSIRSYGTGGGAFGCRLDGAVLGLSLLQRGVPQPCSQTSKHHIWPRVPDGLDIHLGRSAPSCLDPLIDRTKMSTGHNDRAALSRYGALVLLVFGVWGKEVMPTSVTSLQGTVPSQH